MCENGFASSPDWGWGAAGFGGPKGGSKTQWWKVSLERSLQCWWISIAIREELGAMRVHVAALGAAGAVLDAVSGAVAVAGSVVVPGVVFVAQAGVSERMLLKVYCLWRIINKASLVNPNVLSGDLLCCCIFLVGWINEMIKGCVSNKSANMLINCLSLSLQNQTPGPRYIFLGIWQTWTNDSTYPPRSFVRCPMPPVNLPLGLFLAV